MRLAHIGRKGVMVKVNQGWVKLLLSTRLGTQTGASLCPCFAKKCELFLHNEFAPRKEKKIEIDRN